MRFQRLILKWCGGEDVERQGQRQKSRKEFAAGGQRGDGEKKSDSEDILNGPTGLLMIGCGMRDKGESWLTSRIGCTIK